MDRRDIAKNAAAAAARARRAQNQTPEPEASQDADPAAGASSGPDVKAAAATTVANAARGAMTGGAAGALRGVAVGAVKDQNTRKIFFTVIGIIVALALIVVMAFLNSTSGASVVLIQNQDDTNSEKSAREAGVEEEVLEQVESSEHSNLPWQVQAAALDTFPEADLGALEAKLDELDPSRDFRDFTIYATRSSHSATMVAQVDDSPGKEYYEKNEEIHLEAFTAAGMDDTEAATAYELAMTIMLGVNACVPSGDNPPPGGGSGDDTEFTYDGGTYNAAQVANMKTLIGLSKTMFPSDWEKAAVVGLITARVESTYQNYANDGIVGDEDSNMAPYTETDYEKLAYSLTLPHDVVGSDHASVGIMQQQATIWGALPGSSFATDSEGVIERLMTPAYAAALFYERLPGVDGWQDLEPGDVAQTIQGSAHPDEYEKHIDLAGAILEQYGDDQGPMSVPDDIGWGGPDNSGDVDGDGNVTSECGESTPGEGTVPTGDEKQLAQQILAASDAGQISWYAPAPEGYDQIAAYASGATISDDCTLDMRVLQLLVMTTEEFNQMSINSLNRRCTENYAGLGEDSAHWRGQAGDIGNLNGKYTTDNPAIPEAYQWWEMFAKVAVNSGGGLGQAECREWKSYDGIDQYLDPCNHLHFEIGRGGNTEPLK